MQWIRARKEEAEEYGRLFVRRKMLRKMGEFSADMLQEFTPDGLEHFINSGLSLVEEIAKRTPQKELLKFAQEAQDYQDVAVTISAEDVLAKIEERLPSHARVLRQHPSWSAAELARIKQILFPPAVIRTRVALPERKG